jgi:hypothetical protein
MNNVQQIAAKDIAQELMGLNVAPQDNFEIRAYHVFTKESRRLNKALGLHSINK